MVLVVFNIEHSVYDEGGSLQPILSAGRERPHRHQLLHILTRDLAERTVTPRPVIAVEGERVLRTFVGVLDARSWRCLGSHRTRPGETANSRKHDRRGHHY